MESLKLLIIGIVQGVTELLPISSSGHILIFSEILNISSSSLILTFFHVGTTLAILLFFREKIFKEILKKERITFLLKIIISSIPAALIGALFEDFISEKLRAIPITAISLIVVGIAMIIIEKKSKKETEIEEVTWKQSLLMGVSQTFALIPGVSRSGITTLTGILTGLNKYIALEYSLILGIPILLGGFLWETLKLFFKDSQAIEFTTQNIFTGLIILLVPFCVGYLALHLLKKFKKSNWLTAFGIYRIILGVFLLLISL